MYVRRRGLGLLHTLLLHTLYYTLLQYTCVDEDVDSVAAAIGVDHICLYRAQGELGDAALTLRSAVVAVPQKIPIVVPKETYYSTALTLRSAVVAVPHKRPISVKRDLLYC